MIAVCLGASCTAWAQVEYHAGTTRKVQQLTGDYDTALRRNTLTQTSTQAGVIGTDLGSSILHNGKLWFFFGDTAGAVNWGDTIAHTTATSAAELDNLTFLMNGSRARTINIPGISEGGMEVPSGAISTGSAIYLVQTTDWEEPNMTRSVMARSTNNGVSWTNLYTLSQGVNGNMTHAHFINVSMRIVDAADYGGLLPWSSGEVVLIWGSGAYRSSNVYLACIPVAGLASKAQMRYLTAVNQGNIPVWGTSEADAIPLFSHPIVGEFSCGWLPQQNRWIMLYQGAAWGGTPRGVHMRTAPVPWGAWSAPRQILTPGSAGDHAYETYMHTAWSWGHRDNMQDHIMGGDNDWGGEYGPYLIENFTTGDTANTQIYYTMSTWNPYQVLLMKSEIGPQAFEVPPVSGAQTLTLGDPTWHKSSPTFYRSAVVGGVPGISTWTGQGDAATGLMWRWLPRDQWNRQLTFNVTSGRGEVILIEGGGDIPLTGDIATRYAEIKAGLYGDVIQCKWGHSSNDIIIPVRWPLSSFDRANLKVVVIDYATDGWSFVGVSNMTLTRNVPAAAYELVQRIMPGDGAWTQTSADWYHGYTRVGEPYISTQGAAGVASQGLMWRMLPRDWRNKRLQFKFHGEGGRVLLLQGGDPIPTSGDFAAIAGEIDSGKYGEVREEAHWTGQGIAESLVSWDLTRHKSHDLKVVILDTRADAALDVSRMTLRRFHETPMLTGAGGDWMLYQ